MLYICGISASLSNNPKPFNIYMKLPSEIIGGYIIIQLIIDATIPLFIWTRWHNSRLVPGHSNRGNMEPLDTNMTWICTFTTSSHRSLKMADCFSASQRAAGLKLEQGLKTVFPNCFQSIYSHCYEVTWVPQTYITIWTEKRSLSD